MAHVNTGELHKRLHWVCILSIRRQLPNLPTICNLRMLVMTSYHMRSPDSNPTFLLTEMASIIVVLSSFKTHARGIHLYEVDCCRLRSGSEVILRRQPSRYDSNVVDILILHSGPA